MENGSMPHHTLALKHIYALSLLLLTACSLSAQTTVGANEILYNSEKRMYYLRSTNLPFTGRAYSVNYYTPKDTTMLQGYTNGKLDYTKSFSNGKPYYSQYYYNSKLKKDSICYEYYVLDQYSGDTTYYEYHWIDKNKNKCGRSYNYHPRYSIQPKYKKVVSVEQNFRFFSKKDTKDFTDGSYKYESQYDSAGYHSTKEMTGYYATYYANGKVQTEGRNCVYENRLRNKGVYNYYEQHCGVWKYYDQNGVLTRTDEYVSGTYTPLTCTYHANGKIATKTNYKKKGAEIKLPPTQGINIASYDEYTVTSTTWHPNGLISVESVRNANGDVITYAYYETGKPLSVQATNNQNKPYGVHKSWDVKGNVYDYTNYSVDWIDTVCYTAVDGKIQKLNLRDRSVPINWTQMPTTYYGNETRKYLYGKVSEYKTFHRNGRLKSHVHLKNGRMDGLYMEYDSTGTQIVQSTYKQDIPDGAWTEWYPNGKVKKSFYFKNGLREGNCTEYYPTGVVKWENIYRDGTSGTPKAYSENGTLLPSSTYLQAFYPPMCIETQAKNVRGAALHYYFMDTTVSRSSVTIADSAVQDYTYKVIAMTNAITPGYDMCEAQSTFAKEEGFDIYHSCFVLSKSLYTDANLAKIKSFFGRHGITMDKTEPSANPVLGLEKEFLVYYSAKQMLNKQLVIDSLETYLAPRAIDAKQGYILSLDNNVPEGGLTGIGSKAVITSDTGHCNIVVEAGTRNTSYPQYDTFHTTTYVVYDDLTCDVKGTVYTTPPILYWAGK